MVVFAMSWLDSHPLKGRTQIVPQANQSFSKSEHTAVFGFAPEQLLRKQKFLYESGLDTKAHPGKIVHLIIAGNSA